MNKYFLIFGLAISGYASADNDLDAFYQCVKNEAVKYSATGEQTDSIASASVSACKPTLHKTLENNVPYQNASPSAKQSFTQSVAEQGKELAVKVAMDEKLKAKGNQ
ncbi:hypothetical protein [Serratia proteamaculans]|uniref:hypothetical protein n=1 Tax=Serratia proteamaculans TaxID=28151 RepID=UPI00217A4B6C|nr:hypothetical protein [Serratia proteamaculans]CAI1022489.1 Uncharacterised protein [Serratia proteamaculans]CAI1032553.1 Uncharacterised protein [Serratia proteamaculans]